MGKEKMGTEKRRRGENRDAEKGNGEKRMEKVVKIETGKTGQGHAAATRSSAAPSPRAQHPRAPPRALSYRAPISQGDGPGCAQCTLRFGTRRSTPFLPVQRASRPGFLLSAAFSVFSTSIEGKPGGGGRTASFLPSLLCCSVRVGRAPALAPLWHDPARPHWGSAWWLHPCGCFGAAQHCDPAMVPPGGSVWDGVEGCFLTSSTNDIAMGL